MIRILYEFAKTRDEIRDSLDSKSDIYITHLFKIFFMRDYRKDDLNHWCREVGDFYKKVDRFKGSKKFPSYKFIYDNILGDHEDIFDNIFILNQEYLRNEYNFDIYEDDIDNIFKFIQEYTQWLARELSTKGVVLRDTCVTKLKELLEKRK